MAVADRRRFVALRDLRADEAAELPAHPVGDLVRGRDGGRTRGVSGKQPPFTSALASATHGRFVGDGRAGAA